MRICIPFPLCYVFRPLNYGYIYTLKTVHDELYWITVGGAEYSIKFDEKSHVLVASSIYSYMALLATPSTVSTFMEHYSMTQFLFTGMFHVLTCIYTI